MNMIMKYMSRSIAEELEDVPQEAIGPYFEQIGKIVSWIGSGDDELLPDGLREYLSARMGTDLPAPVVISIEEADATALELETEAAGY
jgi:tetrahydromethanopterin S-methyltransferase subunit A